MANVLNILDVFNGALAIPTTGGGGGGSQTAPLTQTILASASRSADTISATFTNPGFSAIVIFFDVTVAPGGDTVELSFQAENPLTGLFKEVEKIDPFSNVALHNLSIGPGARDNYGGGGNAAVEVPLPEKYQVEISHSGVGSFTYSVSAVLVGL